MLGLKTIDARHARTSRHVIKRRIPFAQRNGMFRRNMGQQFTKPPDSALVKSVA